MAYIDLGTNREMFWTDYLVDTQKTTAVPFQNEPVKMGYDFLLNSKLECLISYPCLVPVDGGYRMYYNAWKLEMVDDHEHWNYICVIESTDGIHWTRPELGIVSIDGSTANNAVIGDVTDSFYIFRDPNPTCPPEALYKAVGLDWHNEDKKQNGLWCYISPDGYHFTRSHLMTVVGRFDTLNTVQFRDGKYSCYLRNFHNIPDGGDQYDGILEEWRANELENLNEGIRDVRVMYSDDFIHWTTPELIQFEDGLDYPLYTNQIIAYPRAPQILVGFPTRYTERHAWTPNYDRLGSADLRKKSIEAGNHPRLSLAITDCIFISSRDGKLWNRDNRAFMTPGYEGTYNWVYGDCYPAYGLVDNGDENYYMYTVGEHLVFSSPEGLPKARNPLVRWAIRKDGFAGYQAGGNHEDVLVTKPLTFDGETLYLNFSTSAYGHIYVDVLNEDGTEIENATSFEVFGNNIDAPICLADGRGYSEFASKPVRLRFRMLDAKLYSLRFA